jgi:Domain of unknown function (DUF4118)
VTAEATTSTDPATRLSWQALVLAVLAPLVVSGLLVLVRGEILTTNAALVLVVTVVIAAAVGGRWGGVVAAVTAAVCFDFFFTRPYYSFSINSRDDLETTILLLIVGLIVGELVVRTRRSELVAHASRREVEKIRRVAAVSAGGESAGKLIRSVPREIVDVLGARGARFERPPFATALPRVGHGSVTLPAEDPEGGGRPVGPRNEIAIPIFGHGREVGRFVVVLPGETTGVTLDPEDRALAVALTDQLGAALAEVNDGS